MDRNLKTRLATQTRCGSSWSLNADLPTRSSLAKVAVSLVHLHGRWLAACFRRCKRGTCEATQLGKKGLFFSFSPLFVARKVSPHDPTSFTLGNRVNGDAGISSKVIACNAALSACESCGEWQRALVLLSPGSEANRPILDSYSGGSLDIFLCEMKWVSHFFATKCETLCRGVNSNKVSCWNNYGVFEGVPVQMGCWLTMGSPAKTWAA